MQSFEGVLRDPQHLKRFCRFADPLELWRRRAKDVRGEALPGGHYINEEAPRQVEDWLLRFFGG